MATLSPSPNSSPSPVSSTSSSPLSQPSSPPPASSTSPPSSPPHVNPPDPLTPTPSPPPPPQSPPATNMTSSPPPSITPPPPPPSVSPSPAPPVVPPPPANSPPLSSTPPASSPPPPSSNPSARSPPPPSGPPVSSPPPPLSSSPPPPSSTSPPPPSSSPPPSSPPPPPTKNSPPPSNPLASSPPPPASQPPQWSPPPLSARPPKSSPPPPPSNTPRRSPPPPPSNIPESPTPPASTPPTTSPPPPTSTPPSGSAPPASPPTPNAPPRSPPPPSVEESPFRPPPLLSPPSPSPPSPSQVPVPSSGSPATNSSSDSSSTNNGGLGTGGAVAIGLILGFVLLSLLGTAAWCIRKRQRKISGFNGGYVIPTSLGSSPKSDAALLKVQMGASHIGSGSGSDFARSLTEPGGLGNSRSWFNYEELVQATDGFSAENLLGEGGFGSVYKGFLPDGREIAVKQLKLGGGQGEREFKAEVEIISRIHHRHLVSLVGYCISEERRLLVYDYVPNNTLHFHLHREGRPVMDWAIRMKIAAGAARGIAYLHEDCHPRIIHRDIKSSNILLDHNFEARVSDFGLAKLALDTNSHVTTRVMGTFGYMAPEYASSGRLTEKSDVFSFGVVLLELITGRKPVDASQPLGDESLVEWARPLLGHALDTEEFEDLVDPRLEKNYVASEVFRMIEAAASCVRHSAAKRPLMGQVVRALDSMFASDLNNGMRVGESEMFNSAEQSEEISLFRNMAFGIQDYSTDFFSNSNWDSSEEPLAHTGRG